MARKNAWAQLAEERAAGRVAVPQLDGYINEDWRERRLASLIVARPLLHRRVQAAFFLVDLNCLGVKDCFTRRIGRRDFLDVFLAEHEAMFRMVRCEPGLAAAILQQAVAFARDLGFEPHREFERASGILDGVEPQSAESIELGDGGRPFYVAGPHDDPIAVLARLTNKLGPDGFGYIAPVDPEAEVLEVDLKAAAVMIPLHEVLPELARKETRSITLLHDQNGLPADAYHIIERFCKDPGCDCRRLMLEVIAEKHRETVAMINVAFDREDEMPGPFLDPLATQGPLAPALLGLFEDVLLTDSAYMRRLEAHYHQFKRAVARIRA